MALIAASSSGYWMLLQLLEEALRKLCSLKGQPTLIASVLLDEKGTIHDGLVDQAGGFRTLNVECQATPADAFRLVLHELAGPTADTDANPPEPIPQRSAQLDLSRAGAKRLRLQVE